MKAVIYHETKTVMQSGHARAQKWVLEYDEPVTRHPESLNGWTSADSTLDQVQLKFASLDAAKTYAENKGLQYIVKANSERKVRPRNYSDNFKYIPPEDD